MKVGIYMFRKQKTILLPQPLVLLKITMTYNIQILFLSLILYNSLDEQQYL